MVVASFLSSIAQWTLCIPSEPLPACSPGLTKTRVPLSTPQGRTSQSSCLPSKGSSHTMKGWHVPTVYLHYQQGICERLGVKEHSLQCVLSVTGHSVVAFIVCSHVWLHAAVFCTCQKLECRTPRTGRANLKQRIGASSSAQGTQLCTTSVHQQASGHSWCALCTVGIPICHWTRAFSQVVTLNSTQDDH